MLHFLAGLAHRRGREVVVVAVALAVAAGVFGSSVASRLHPYGADDPATDSIKARDALSRATGFDPAVDLVALVDTGAAGPRSPATRAKVERVRHLLAGDRRIARVESFYETGNHSMVARDGRSQWIAAHFRPVGDKVKQDTAKRLDHELAGEPGVRLGGFAAAAADVNRTVERDLRTAELLAFPLLFLLSLLFFRSLVASALPLFVGGLAIVGTFVILRIASELTDISIFALNLTTGLGLGLAIDYSLFMVARYREEIARSGPGLEALERTLASAGRTVLFSSLTVAGALASLLLFPQRFLYSMGLGGSLVALFAATVAVVVLPAVLALLGARVNALAPRWLRRTAEREARPTSAGGWYRLSRFVMRRPAPVAAVSALVLVALGLPFLGIKFSWVDATVLPTSSEARQVDTALKSDFPQNRTSPLYLAVEAPSGARVRAYAARLRALPGAAAVVGPRAVSRDMSLIQVISSAPELDDRSQQLVRDIRSQRPGFGVLAGGRAAEFLDFKGSLGRHLPAAFAIVALTTMIVLFLMTGSVVLPLKALVMNVLTLSATYGVLILIFQDGRLEGLLSYASQGGIETSMAVLIFAVAFGLSTDYGVFLLSRIKEARAAGASDREAVAIGLERTGRIVTAAALLFSVAIGAFATSQIVFLKQTGIGAAAAVLIDASIIRALLVPSLMELLGRRNWWAPGPLRRLHDRIGLEEGGPAARPTPVYTSR